MGGREGEVEICPLEMAVYLQSGRITLIKSTLASMPLYQLSLFHMPKIVTRRLEKLQRDFLWEGGNMERKTHLVNWEMVCADKENGGLGLRKLVLLNKALLETKKANGAFGVGVLEGNLKESDWYWDNMAFNVEKGTRIRF
ncbi:putative ribonuclease H protein [Vitis vinifera]|uniref:Putative ribonuclease H protein n=1 Tax=Vitis vinifera TaxID=29760 RepID=A0A438FBD2_VITVI|nr:putative ribonuclease H protein [Vitis vinifera]